MRENGEITERTAKWNGKGRREREKREQKESGNERRKKCGKQGERR